jgi:hypothetical protein
MRNKHGRTGAKRHRVLSGQIQGKTVRVQVNPHPNGTKDADAWDAGYHAGEKKGFRDGVNESARFYKLLVAEIRQANSIREVRRIFERLEEGENV